MIHRRIQLLDSAVNIHDRHVVLLKFELDVFSVVLNQKVSLFSPTVKCPGGSSASDYSGMVLPLRAQLHDYDLQPHN